MTIPFEMLQKWPKKPQDVMEWRQEMSENFDAIRIKMDKLDAVLISLEERKRLKKERKKFTFFLLVSILICTGVFLLCFGTHEATRMRGMTLAFRNESLPVSLPPGKMQLRTIASIVSNRPHGIRLFSPFVAASQKKGEISVVTNYTNPHYLAYTVRHPELDNVVMTHSSARRVLASGLVIVALPDGLHFVRAEYCSTLYDRQCRIVTQTDGGEYHFAAVVLHSMKETPTIADDGLVRYPQELLTVGQLEVRAFRTYSEYDRLVAWFDDKLAFISTDQITGREYVTLIDDVDYHEAVEIHGIADGVWALLVMRQEAEMRTKLRIYIIRFNTVVVRYQELTVHNRPAAINIVRRDETFEICELADASSLKCYTNLNE
ncbi:hypothetical protein PRIPAC_70293 [Pristionchus pacificus]|uniref:Uncharacterized protein n=1 Tax=Pristionchus pacificus TaxID=54126 RepID=A0A2A6C0L6_PRIPA|nr:hypothetical protein PRIPAC_70293 [Pristionchus pacificus]|eukprot:PDM71668.1 hypothetical protein PRIPAC_38075 [Pristionchus pacificus]